MLEQVRSGAWISRERVRLISLVCIAGYLLSMFVLIVTSDGRLDRLGRPVGTDFSQVWVAGKMVLEGHPERPFDPVPHAARQAQEFSPKSGFFHWGYPPYFLVLAAFFALFPYLMALLLWQGLTLPVYLAAAWKMLPRRETLLLAAAYPAVLINFGHGHNGFLTAGLLGLGIAFLMKKRPWQAWVAGALFGLVAYKPQFGLLIPLALAAGGYWRAFAGASLCVLAMTAGTWAAFGTQTWQAFLVSLEFSRSFVAEQGATGWHKIPSVFSWARMWGAGVPLAYVFQGLTMAFCAVSVAALWYRGSWLPVLPKGGVDRRLAGAALLVSALLATPYFLDYDLMVMGPALVLYVAYAMERGFRPWEKSLLALIWAMPIFARNVTMMTYIPVATVLLFVFLGMVLRRAGEEVLQGAAQEPGHAVRPGPAPALLRQLGAFGIAGVAGFIADASLTLLFAKVAGLSPFAARIPAIALAVLLTWFMNRTWTFRSNDPGRVGELARYGAVSAASALVNYLTYALILLALAGGGAAIKGAGVIAGATAAGSLVAAALTFILSRHFAFRGANVPSAPAAR